MIQNLPGAATLIALIAATCAPASAAWRQDAGAVPTADTAAVPAAEAAFPSAYERELRAIGGALRASRRSNGADSTPLVDRIVRSGPNAIEATFEVLVRRVVPHEAAQDARQILSDPQRKLVLEALARQSRTKVRAHVTARVRGAPPEAGDVRLAAVHALGAIGSSTDLKSILVLAPRKAGDEAALTRDARSALRDATAAILARDHVAWAQLPGILRSADAAIARPLVDAAASVRDPRALTVLYHSVTSHPDLAPLAVSAVQHVGPSLDPDVTREFAAWMADQLPTARREHREGLLRGIGALDDGTHAELLIGLLEDEEPLVREAAAWGLREMTGFGYGTTPEPWRAWLADETRWNETQREKARADLSSPDASRVANALRAYSARRAWRESLAEDVAVVLDRDEPQLRLLACEVLQNLDAQSSIRTIAPLLAAPEEGIRAAARRALGEITGLDLPADPGAALEALELL